MNVHLHEVPSPFFLVLVVFSPFLTCTTFKFTGFLLGNCTFSLSFYEGVLILVVVF